MDATADIEAGWMTLASPGGTLMRVRRPAARPLLSYSEAARLLGKSRGWVMAQIKAGRLETRMWMGRTWVDRSGVERALESLAG